MAKVRNLINTVDCLFFYKCTSQKLKPYLSEKLIIKQGMDGQSSWFKQIIIDYRLLKCFISTSVEISPLFRKKKKKRFQGFMINSHCSHLGHVTYTINTIFIDYSLL